MSLFFVARNKNKEISYKDGFIENANEYLVAQGLDYFH